MTREICIIKLGALGDVVRTLSILPAIKEKYPDSEICWVTKENALDLFKNNPYVDKVYSIPFENSKGFDALYNFDIESDATNLVKEIKADEKYGFYDEDGYTASFNLAGEYYINTIFDDELKKSNNKTYQEMMFGAAELEYKGQKAEIYLNDQEIKEASDFAESNNINLDKLIGIHMGASSRWPSKAWSEEKVEKFIVKAKQRGYEILLFGGPNEVEKQRVLLNRLKEQDITVHQNNPNNSLREFIALANLCKIVVCADSLALHIALALKKPTIALFFCTSYKEVEDYGLLRKIVSPMQEEFFPEKMDQYSEELVNSISEDEVLEEIDKIENE